MISSIQALKPRRGADNLKTMKHAFGKWTFPPHVLKEQLASCSTTSSKSVKFLQMQRQGPVTQTGTQTVEVTQLQCVDMRCSLRGRPAEMAEAPVVAEACFDRRADLKARQRSSCANYLFSGRDMDSDGRLMWKELDAAARDDLEELERAHPDQMQKVIMDLEAQFTSSMSDKEDQLFKPSRENEHLQKQHGKCLVE